MRASLFVFGQKLRLAGKQAHGYCWGVVVEEGEEGVELVLEVELLKVELLAGLEVLLAGWPIVPVLPPLMVCISESGSYVNSHSL
jgi:hypothetical protein